MNEISVGKMGIFFRGEDDRQAEEAYDRLARFSAEGIGMMANQHIKWLQEGKLKRQTTRCRGGQENSNKNIFSMVAAKIKQVFVQRLIQLFETLY